MGKRALLAGFGEQGQHVSGLERCFFTLQKANVTAVAKDNQSFMQVPIGGEQLWPQDGNPFA
jgi:hypothetical protein